jgi:hypothetical protein
MTSSRLNLSRCYCLMQTKVKLDSSQFFCALNGKFRTLDLDIRLYRVIPGTRIRGKSINKFSHLRMSCLLEVQRRPLRTSSLIVNRVLTLNSRSPPTAFRKNLVKCVDIVKISRIWNPMDGAFHDWPPVASTKHRQIGHLRWNPGRWAGRHMPPAITKSLA